MTKERLGMPGPAQPCQNEKWLYRTGGGLGDENRCGNHLRFRIWPPESEPRKVLHLACCRDYTNSDACRLYFLSLVWDRHRIPPYEDGKMLERV